MLNDKLRDRLVCGINDDHIHSCLLAEANLKFKTAFTLAQAMEATERNTLQLQATSSDQVHAIKTQVTQGNL